MLWSVGDENEDEEVALLHMSVGMIEARYTRPTLDELSPQTACRRRGRVTSRAAKVNLMIIVRASCTLLNGRHEYERWEKYTE